MAAVGAARPVVIVGAGLTGLAAAWELARRCPEKSVVVLEASKRAGGCMETTVKDGFVFDRGPHGIRRGEASYAICDLAFQLGLQDQVVFPGPPSSGANIRYIHYRGRLRKVPPGTKDILRPGVFGRGLLMAGIGEVFVPKTPKAADDSIHNFASHRFGRPVADVMFGTLCHGIYAGNAKQLSLRACFPDLHRCQQSGQSVVLAGLRGRTSEPIDTLNAYDRESAEFIKKCQKVEQWNLKGGVDGVTKALEHSISQLPNVQMFLSTPCIGLRVGSGEVEVRTEGLAPIMASHVISTVSSPQLAEMLTGMEEGERAAAWKEVGALLRGVPQASVAVVNAGYKTPVLPLKAYGYLVPPCEQETILGVIFDSCVFPDQDHDPAHQRLTVMLGGHRMEEVFGTETPDTNTVVSTALSALQRHLGVTKDPDALVAKVHRGGIPQYPVGHVDSMERLKDLLASLGGGRLAVAGSSYKGVSVNDCVRMGRHVGRAIGEGNGDLSL